MSFKRFRNRAVDSALFSSSTLIKSNIMDILLKAVQRIKHRYSDNKVTFDRLIEVLNVAEDIKQEEIAQKDIQYEIAMNEIHKHKNPF